MVIFLWSGIASGDMYYQSVDIMGPSSHTITFINQNIYMDSMIYHICMSNNLMNFNVLNLIRCKYRQEVDGNQESP
jgi:hypothetical protein